MQRHGVHYNTTCHRGDRELRPVRSRLPASFWPIPVSRLVPGTDVRQVERIGGRGRRGPRRQVERPRWPPLRNQSRSSSSATPRAARVVSNEMTALATLDRGQKARTRIVMIGNIGNPDGGLWPRLSFLCSFPIWTMHVRASDAHRHRDQRPPTTASNTTPWATPRSSGAIPSRCSTRSPPWSTFTATTWPPTATDPGSAAVRVHAGGLAGGDPNNAANGGPIHDTDLSC